MKAVTIVERARGAAIATDDDGRIRAWNRGARDLFGFDGDHNVLGRRLLHLLKVRDLFGNPVTREPLDFWEMASRGEAVQPFEYDARNADGGYVRVSISVVVVLGPDEGEYELVYLLRPVRRRRKSDEVIERILANPEGLKPHLRTIEGRSGEVPDLTPRQIEVLRYLAQGSRAEEIAESLGVSLHTVRTHLQNIFEKLGVHSQIEAVSRAYRDRLI